MVRSPVAMGVVVISCAIVRPMTSEPATVSRGTDRERELTVRLSSELHERLRRRALDGDQHMSQVLRCALREYLDQPR